MARTTVKLLSQRLQNQISKVIDGNTVILDYSFFQGQKPDSIEIKVFRTEVITPQTPSIQAMGGTYPLNGIFSMYNTNGGERQKGDGVLTDKIYELCADVFNDNLKIE